MLDDVLVSATTRAHDERSYITVDIVIKNWQKTSLMCFKYINLLLQLQLSNHQISLRDDSSVNVVAETTPLDMNDLLAKMNNVNYFCDDEISSPWVISSLAQLQPLGNEGVMRSVQDFVVPLLWSSCVAGLRDVIIFNNKKRRIGLHHELLSNSLKLSNNMVRLVDSILSHARDFKILAEALNDARSGCGGFSLCLEDFREDIGIVVRSCQQCWQSSILFACALDLAATSFPDKLCSDELTMHQLLTDPVTLWNERGMSPIAAIILKYQCLIDAIILLQLDEAWKTISPYYHGKAMLNVLDVPAGPVVGALMDFQLRWQLRNPMGTKEACLKALILQKDHLLADTRN